MGGSGGGGVEVSVFDGGVDTGIGAGLDLLQNGEQATQGIGDIGAVGVE